MPESQPCETQQKCVLAHLSGKHATGGDVIGIYPLTADEHCYFLAIDFDGDDWQRDVSAFRSTCRDLGLTAYCGSATHQLYHQF